MRKNNVPLDTERKCFQEWGHSERSPIFCVPGTQPWSGLVSTTTTVKITESLSQIKTPVTYLPRNRDVEGKGWQMPWLQNESRRSGAKHSEEHANSTSGAMDPHRRQAERSSQPPNRSLLSGSSSDLGQSTFLSSSLLGKKVQVMLRPRLSGPQCSSPRPPGLVLRSLQEW